MDYETIKNLWIFIHLANCLQKYNLENVWRLFPHESKIPVLP